MPTPGAVALDIWRKRRFIGFAYQKKGISMTHEKSYLSITDGFCKKYETVKNDQHVVKTDKLADSCRVRCKQVHEAGKKPSFKALEPCKLLSARNLLHELYLDFGKL
jgi:hypothetical protein